MRPDLVVVWPDAFRFPLYEKWLLDNCHYFNKVIVRFTRSNLPYDHSDEVLKKLGTSKFWISWEPRNTPGDWRHNATIAALEQSTAEYVLFMEQDFEVRNIKVMHKVLQAAAFGHPLSYLGFKEGDRLHPAFLFVSRFLISRVDTERGGLDFSVDPGVGDHFCKFTAALAETGTLHELESCGFHQPQDFYHMAGLTHNLSLYRSGLEVVHKPDEFFEYLKKCRELDPNAYTN